MKLNDFGQPLDRNGYAPSIMQEDTSECFLCGRTNVKLDRHEPWGGALRQKSKALGMWCSLCHDSCHQYGPYSAHQCRETNDRLKRGAQAAAMINYGWSKEDFIREFGKNLMDEED